MPDKQYAKYLRLPSLQLFDKYTKAAIANNTSTCPTVVIKDDNAGFWTAETTELTTFITMVKQKSPTTIIITSDSSSLSELSTARILLQFSHLFIVANTANTAPVPYYGVISESGPTRLLNTNPGTGNATSSSDFASVTSTGGIRYTNTAYSTSTAASHADIRSIQGETTTNGTYHKIFTLAPGVTKFRVYMWVEGQDVDCENNASNAYLRFNIGLSLLDGSSSGTTQP